MSAATLAYQRGRKMQQQRVLSSHQDAWTKLGVVPDVVSVVPPAPAQVHWGPRENPQHCHLGQELPTAVVAAQPLEFHWSGRPDQLYTVLLVDPDAPSRSNPAMRSFLHWAVVNVPGEERARGDTLAEYTGAAPPPGTGLHRYVFLVYQQKGKADVSKMDKISSQSSEGRAGFNVEKWIGSIGGADWTLINGNVFTAQAAN